MLDYFLSWDNQQIMLVGVLCMLATMVFPRLIRHRRDQRTRWNGKSKLLKKDALQAQASAPAAPAQRNGSREDLERFLLRLRGYARTHHMKIVFPGNAKCGEGVSAFTMLLVGGFGVLGIHCYGFGGRICERRSGRWEQVLNGEHRDFPDPVAQTEAERAMLEHTLAAQSVPFGRVLGMTVFTTPEVTLSLSGATAACTAQGCIEALCQQERYAQDNGTDVKALTDLLVSLVRAASADASDKGKDPVQK
jgi:hypothetical protein